MQIVKSVKKNKNKKERREIGTHQQTGIDFRKAMYSIHTGPDAMSVPEEFKHISYVNLF